MSEISDYISRDDLYNQMIKRFPGAGYDETGEVCKQLVVYAPTADVTPVVRGHWEWFEEWDPGSLMYPSELSDCGWRCDQCKTSLEDSVGGYWDDPDSVPRVKCCPECGAKMYAVGSDVRLGELRSRMDHRVSEIRRAREYESLAKEDEMFAEMLIEYKNLKGE